MKRTHSSSLILLAVLLTGAIAAAQLDGIAGLSEYDLTWHTIDGGGGTSTGSGYELAGTIGQPDAGTMSGGDFTLLGGFWAGGIDVEPDCPIPADLNCDGVVNALDLLILLGAWGVCPNPSDCPADLNGDGEVNALDLLILLGSWG